MNNLTFLVERFDNEEVFTPGDALTEMVFRGFHPDADIYRDINWNGYNQNLIKIWNAKNIFNLKLISEYNSDLPNPHYLINFSLETSFMNGTFFMIPERSKKIIRDNNIPILMFYPMEYLKSHGYPGFFKLMRTARDLNGLKNVPIKVLSVSSFYKQDSQILKIEELDESLRNSNIYWIQSLAFLDYHNNNSVYFPDLSFSNLIKEGTEIYLEDHETNKKTHLCLSLNNRPRDNRYLFALALHTNREGMADILYSQRFSLADGASKMILNNYLNVYENKNTQLLEEIDKLEFFDINQLTDYVSKLRESDNDSFQTFILKIYETIRKNNLPNILYLDDIDNMYQANDEWKNEWYLDSWCSIVTETFDNDSGMIESPMVSEKTVKAILNYHPFYIFGHNYNNKLFRDLGFKTFEESWFEMPPEGAYGNSTILERLHNLILSLKKLSKLTDDELMERWQNIKSDLLFNRNLLLNTDWGQVQAKLILNPN